MILPDVPASVFEGEAGNGYCNRKEGELRES
jgi:hypothetical protein